MIFTGRKNATLRSRSRSLRVTRMEQERTEETEKSAESFGVGAGQDQSGNAVLETLPVIFKTLKLMISPSGISRSFM